MKRFILILLAICLFLSISGISFADNKGSSIIPHFKTDDTTGNDYSTYIYISNISSVQATVTITFYKKDGSVQTDGDNNNTTGSLQASSNFGLTWNDNLGTTASASFNLNARCSGWVKIKGTLTSENFGYGLIEWSPTVASKVIRCLVAHGEIVCPTGTSPTEYSRYDIPINDGRPF